MKKLTAWIAILAVAGLAQEVKRPKILGVAHMALYVSDLGKARAFYKDFLGFDEPYQLSYAQELSVVGPPERESHWGTPKILR
jgi:catechol-2,3-dioxygenase